MKGTTRPDAAWMRERLDQLCAFDRPSASEGERLAADWLSAQLRDAGARDARVEEEPEANGTFWWSIGLLAGAGALAGLAARRGGRLSRALATMSGAAASALLADEMPPGRRRFRRLLPKRSAHHVLAELGPPDAERTIVVMAHHDAAHTRLLLQPRDHRDGRREGALDLRERRHQPAADVAGGRGPGPGGGRGGAGQPQADGPGDTGLGRKRRLHGGHRLARSRARRERQWDRLHRPDRARPRPGRAPDREHADSLPLHLRGGALRGHGSVHGAPCRRATQGPRRSSSASIRSARRTYWCCEGRGC